jgi:hypothetical protein
MDLFKKTFLFVVGFASLTAEETRKVMCAQRKRIAKLIRREHKPAGSKA